MWIKALKWFLFLAHTHRNYRAQKVYKNQAVFESQLIAQCDLNVTTPNPSAVRCKWPCARLSFPRHSFCLVKALSPIGGQVIKKLFVILDWIDHLFSRILFLIIYSLHASSWWKETFISFCIYCIGKQKHSAAFPGGSPIYLLNKRLKFSAGQKN
jgi:hypothetical protein